MKEYLSYIKNVLHVEITEDLDSITENIPAFLSTNFDLCFIRIMQIDIVCAYSKNDMNIGTLRKQVQSLEKATNRRVVLISDKFSQYQTKKFIEENIAYVVPDKHIYMPFLGIVLTDPLRSARVKKGKWFSPSASKLISFIIYNKIRKANLSELSKFTEIPKATMVRCLDELESLYPRCIVNKGKRRYFILTVDFKDFYAAVSPFMKSPVVSEFYVENLPKTADLLQLKLSGISGLSYYSRISDNYGYITYSILSSIYNKNRKLFDILNVDSDVQKNLIQVMSYKIGFNEKCIDPISIALSLTEDSDERVVGQIIEMMEEHVWKVSY